MLHPIGDRMSGSYKSLARKTPVRECGIAQEAVSEMVVDVRSRLFRYMRLVYSNRGQKERALSVFRTMRDLRTTGDVFTERRRVFDAALASTVKEARRMRVQKCTYVFPSTEHCSHRVERPSESGKKFDNLREQISEYRRDMFDLEALERCALALESYLMSDFDRLSKMHAGSERFLSLGQLSEPTSHHIPGCGVTTLPERHHIGSGATHLYVVPDESDSFESDRLCARMSGGIGVSVLSEDHDVVALFGADMMITEVHHNFFVYSSLRDTMDTFGCANRRDLVHKCCVMGTDYNRGLRGVGPVKARKIDAAKAKELFETCTSAQSISPDVLHKFFRT